MSSCDKRSIRGVFFWINTEPSLVYGCYSIIPFSGHTMIFHCGWNIRLLAVLYCKGKMLSSVTLMLARLWFSEVSASFLRWAFQNGSSPLSRGKNNGRTTRWNHFSDTACAFIPSPNNRWRADGIVFARHEFEDITLTMALSGLDKRSFMPIKVLCQVTWAPAWLWIHLEHTAEKHLIE